MHIQQAKNGKSFIEIDVEQIAQLDGATVVVRESDILGGGRKERRNGTAPVIGKRIEQFTITGFGQQYADMTDERHISEGKGRFLCRAYGELRTTETSNS